VVSNSVSHAKSSAAGTALVGLVSLASAMGIGRFAFTPLLPLMQQAYGLTLSQGAWLATANYLGYLVGAVANYVLATKSGRPARWALVVVALTTLAMAESSNMAIWLGLRFISGVASAFVLVGAGAWALGHLAAHRRPSLAGLVFSGVGAGICAAGLVALVASRASYGPDAVWTALGVVALVSAFLSWPYLAVPVPAPAARFHSSADDRLGRDAWILVACYGAFGLGYILPATFLPAAARRLVNDPAVFGWTWPVFGAAAALSTVMVSTIFKKVAPRKMVAGSLLVMAIGVAAPLIRTSLATLVVSALCVGGTFMVTTMAGAQEAARASPGTPTRLMAALSASFAMGQLIGPILVGLSIGGRDPFTVPGVLAVLALLTGAAVLLGRKTARHRSVESLT
jgi:predicted MFS family arabinose efflux permease